MLLIADRERFEALTCRDSLTFYSEEEAAARWPEIETRLAGGESMVFASPDCLSLLEPLWISLLPGELLGQPVTRDCPAGIPPLSASRAAGYLSVRPPTTYALHGLHEESRMDFYPFLVDVDRYGGERGTLGLLLKHYDSSLTKGRFLGGCWYLLSAYLTAPALDALCRSALRYGEDRCLLTRLRPEFPLCDRGERVHLRCQVRNLGGELQAAQLQLEAVTPQGVTPIGTRELLLNPRDQQEVELDWYPEIRESGPCTVRATLSLTDRMLYGLAREETAREADVLGEAVYLRQSPRRRRPRVSTTPTAISINGRTDFWVGTHYYPCTDFYELSYRPLRVAAAAREIEEMERTGVRLCRIWCDPILEEVSIRGMETLLELFADHGIVAIVTFFTSWARWLEVCTSEAQSRFQAADMVDEKYIGLTPYHLDPQEAYISALGRRWKGFSNVIWDLSNEFSVVEESPAESIVQFRAWALCMKEALRRSGAEQPVIFGASCWDTGSENYRCNAGADLVPDHNYQARGALEYLPFYQNSACRGQPFFTEEFGGTWPDREERAREYCYRYHLFLASGNAAALNYEWGVSWLADALSGMPAYLKFQNEKPLEELEGFFLEGRDSYSKTWPAGTAGLCPWIASPEYGCIATGTRTETPARIVMKRIAQLGRGLPYAPQPAVCYLVLPFETDSFRPNAGFPRLTTRLNRWLDALWSRGAQFELWQEDCLEQLPACAQLVLYPNERPIPPALKAVFQRLERRGVTVCRDGDESWMDRLPCVPLTPADRRRLLRRPVPGGSLQILLNDGERRRFQLGKLTIEAAQCGLWLERQGKLTLAGFEGLLELGELSMESSCPVFVRSRGNAALDRASTLEVLPLETGLLRLPSGVSCAEVWNGGQLLAVLPAGPTLEITQELLPYTILLRREIQNHVRKEESL